MKYYLGREGVAFGPYTEYQVRESVRIGIFEEADLALAETGTEWVTIAELLRVQALLPAAEIERGSLATPVAPTATDKPAVRAETSSRQPWWAGERKLSLAVASLVAVICALGVWAVQRPPASPPHETRSAVAVALPATGEPAAVPTGSKIAVTEPLLAVPPVDPVAEADEPDAVTPSPEPQPAGAPHRLIEGRIFIAARNGIKYEPPLVEVRLYLLAQLKPYLEKRTQEANAKFDELKSRIVAAEAEKEILHKAADNAFDAYVQAKPDNRRALEQAVAESKKARELATNDYYDLLQKREDLLSGAFYLEELPPSVSVTHTDEQGRFSFDVPADGQFAVVAGTQRGTDESAERYYWFVPVNIDGEPRKTVLLSNNNLSSHGSIDSLVQTAD